jgi:hypothetical protein
MTKTLSPAAQAVLDAAHDGANAVLFDIGNNSPVPMCAAAALQAAALYCTRDRRVLMTIAAELEAQP